jgi:hypothetical protein
MRNQPTTHARNILLLVARGGLTLTLIAILASRPSWRDHIVLQDGTKLEVLDTQDTGILVESPNNDIRTLQPADYAEYHSGLRTLVGCIGPHWLILAFALHLGVQGLMALRWKILLCCARAGDREKPENPVPLRSTLVWLLQSQAIAAQFAGQLGVDAARAYLSRSPDRPLGRTVSVLAVERILGLAALMGILGTGLALYAGKLETGLFNTRVIGWLMLLGLSAAVLAAVTFRIIFTRYPTSRLGRLMIRGREELYAFLLQLRARPGRILAAACLTLAIHTLTLSNFVILSHGLTFGHDWAPFLVAVPSTNLASVIPNFGIGSILAFEGSMSAILTTIGAYTLTQALSLCAVCRILNLCYWPIPIVALWLNPQARDTAMEVGVPDTTDGHDEERHGTTPRRYPVPAPEDNLLCALQPEPVAVSPSE